MSFLECKVLCILISFIVFLSFCLSSSLFHFKNGLECLPRGSLCVYTFEEIPAAELGFGKFSSSSELLFCCFFFHLHLCNIVCY